MGLINVIPKELEQKIDATLTDAQAMLRELSALLAEARRELGALRALRQRIQAAVGGPQP